LNRFFKPTYLEAIVPGTLSPDARPYTLLSSKRHFPSPVKSTLNRGQRRNSTAE